MGINTDVMMTPRILRKRRYGLSFVLFLAFANCGGLLLATVVPRMGFEELSGRAVRIVHARCVSIDAFVEAETGTIWTRNHFVILDTLKGESAAMIVVTEPGGIVGGQGQWIPGAPQFAPGDESVLFLSQTGTGKWRVYGWGQGNYRISRDAISGEARVKPDLAGAELAAPAGSNQKSEIALQSGPGTAQTLDGLKARIRGQLVRQGVR
jgi:hypothetical protein